MPAPIAIPNTGDEEQQPKQQAPGHAPGRAGADHAVVGRDVVAAVFVVDEHRDRVRLDDQVLGQPPRLVGGRCRGGLVRVPDGDQISHGLSPLSLASLLWPLDPVRPGGVRLVLLCCWETWDTSLIMLWPC
jgi:hypothetical protein